MKNTFGNKEKSKAGTSVAFTAVLLVGFGFPAISEEQGQPASMTFDSVGSMLQDMDRERDTQDHMQSLNECEAEMLNRRLHDTYVRLQERAVELRKESVQQNEGRIAEQISEKIANKEARVALKKAAKQLRMTMSKTNDPSDQADMAERTAIAETAEAALRAAEAALEIAH